MAACDPVVFADVSPETWAGLRARVAARGYAVAGDSGTATDKGVTLTWAYDPAARTLSVQCTKHPLLLPCALINAQIRSLYAGNGG